MTLNIVIILLVLVVNIVIWLFILPWAVNRKMTRFQNDLVNRHYDEVETMYRKMRG